MRLGVGDRPMKEIMNQLFHSSYWSPNIEVLDKDTWRVHYASSYSVILEESKSRYVKGITSFDCGDLDQALQKAKSAVRHELYEIDELLENANKALALTDPWDFVDLYERHLEDNYPFHRRYGSSEAAHEVAYLVDGLRDVDRFLERLKTSNKLEEALEMIQSLEKLEPEVAEYLKHVDLSRFELSWIVGRKDSHTFIALSYDRKPEDGNEGFTTSHERERETPYYSNRKSLPTTARDVINSAQSALREYLEKQLPAEEDSD